MSDKKLGIYVHIPFCRRKCRYCDFLSASYDEEVRKQYVDALIAEIENSAEDFRDYETDTVFIGGGTPSLLEAEQAAGIMAALRKNYNMAGYVECTIECNPGTISAEKADRWLDSGINRLSLGLQSANDNELKELGRIHTAEEFLDSFLLARNCGFMNINIDLMSALPYQTMESFCSSLRSAAGLAPEHLSVYSLIVEENTPLYDWIYAGNENSLPDEETEREMYYETRRILKEYGYERYEVSNYAKKGYECRHNLGYWERKDYAGFGLGAASLKENRRYNNLSDMKEYIRCSGKAKTNVERLSVKDQMAEFMFLGLRKTAGISREQFAKNFGTDYECIYGEVTKELQKKGLLEIKGDSVILTDTGIDLSNMVLAEFLQD